MQYFAAPPNDSPTEAGSVTSDSALNLPEIPVHALLDDTAARFGMHPCIDFMGRAYDYADIADQVTRAAAGLQNLGVGPGVKIGLCLPNTPFAVICYYAILKAGGVVVNYNPLYAPRELAVQIEDSATEMMVTIDLKQIYPKVAAQLGTTCLRKIIVCSMGDILPTFKGLLFNLFQRSKIAAIPVDAHHVAFDDLIDNDGTVTPHPVRPATDIAVLQYTGGTTGTPKGAMLTHANLTANARQILEWCRATGDGIEIVDGAEKMLGVLPLFHVFGMTAVMNLAVLIGAELVLTPRFHASEVLKLIEAHRITIFMGVPTIFTALNGEEDFADYDLSSLKFCISGGAPLPRDIKDVFENSAGCPLVEGYGLSECSPVVTCNPFDGNHRENSAGQAIPGTLVEIRTPDEARDQLPMGEKGEVCIAGPQVMAGYWNQPDATAESVIDGRFHTGDIGYLDADGYLFLVDRIKDLILCGGYNVYPRAIEEAIGEHRAVYQVTVIGIPDEYRGETPKAFVRLHPGHTLTEAALRAFLKDRLSVIEMPEFIEFRDELPVTNIGKLSKKELVAEEAAKRQGTIK
jgi:long-chain acyl-CoA synthetase